MIRTIVHMACAALALASMPSFAVVVDSTSSTLDFSPGQPTFGSPELLLEAERSLAPVQHTAPLNDSMNSSLSRRHDLRPAAGLPPAPTSWGRRAFVTAAIVMLACGLLGALAALMTIARGR
ncbi:MAG: hypothetical protein ACKOOF_08120 [Planctomycetaceae bacterium]